MSSKIWRSQKDGYKESLHYIEGRQRGLITSIKTRWNNFNEATLDGLEWNSMTVIAGRPGSFKTGLQDQIIRDAFELNPGQKFRVLKFNYEMLSSRSIIREYSSVLGKSYKYVCSADPKQGKLTEEDFNKCFAHAKKAASLPIDIIDEALTVNEFEEAIDDYMEEHSYIDEHGIKQYTNTIMTYDHSILTKVAPFEKNGLETLYNLGATITAKKRKYPIAFIILSQLGRGVEAPERNEPGKYGNYILSSDIFGGDALYQHADIVVGLNRPMLQNIDRYGPNRYIIADDKVLVMHFIKARNGSVGLGFFRAEFDKMGIVETLAPPMDKKIKVMI